MNFLKYLSAALGFMCAALSNADNFYGYRAATVDCVVEAAKRQDVPANILLAVASVESGKNGSAIKNSNGSLDLGHFQLNTIHWQKNGLFMRAGISKNDVQWRGCYNAELAAWLIKQRINENTGQDYWTRVANYHSKTQKYNIRYRSKLIPLAEQWGLWLQKNYQTTVGYR